METDGRETWWWHCLLSGITKSLMEVRIHTSPYWLPTVLPPLCPKTPTGECRTISFGKRKMAWFIKKYIWWSLFLLQDWSIYSEVFGCVSALLLMSSLQFMRCFEILLVWITSLVLLANLHTTAITGIYASVMSLSVASLMDITSMSCFFEVDIMLVSEAWGHSLFGVTTWTCKHFCPIETRDDSSVNHSSQFRALLPCYGKQMGFHHIGTRYQ